MAFVYEVNGQRVEFEKEPTEADIDEAARSLGPAPAVAPAVTDGVPGAESPPQNNTVRNTALAAGGAALAYGAYKAAPYVVPAAKAAAPALRKLPMEIARQYVARPITGLAADAAAMASGFPPPTASQQALKAIGQGTQAAAQNVVSTAPAPISPQGMQNPFIQEIAEREQARANRGVVQRGMDYANQMRKIAADKVMAGVRAVAPVAAPVAVGLGAMLTPSNANQNYPVPQKGPYRGMEINPNTGRPWTAQELAQINR
jgi:hypothetical protein